MSRVETARREGREGEAPTSGRSSRRSVPALLYALAGVLLGLGWNEAAIAWPAIAVLAIALVRTERAVAAFAGTWLAGALARWIGLPWLADMNRIALGYDERAARLLMALECVACALAIAMVVSGAFALAARMVRRERRALAMLVWFPPAWALGEHISFSVLGISNEAWLTTQWTVRPVLTVLGHLGWWPTVWLCLLVAASVGVAMAHREPRYAAPLVLVALPAVLPPLESRHEGLLEGIAAAHVVDAYTLPHGPPRGERPDLILWPEEARPTRPLLPEGGKQGARIRPILPGSEASHLVGIVTRSPRGGLRNQLLEVDAHGEVGATRAKRLLLLLGERQVFGFGSGVLRPGSASTVMEVAGRRAVAVICGEMLSRALVAEGVAGGAEVLLTAARDHIMATPTALRNMLAVQVLRSVEYGVPSVRSSMAGRSYFVSSDGRVLASSEAGRNGFLFWDRSRGARDVGFRDTDGERPTRGGPEVAVLYSRDEARLRTPCPEGRCTYHVLDDFVCPQGAAASAVIVAGHGQPPRWLAHSPATIARAVQCFRPDVVVIDACLGASSELLDALGELDAVVVAAPTLVPEDGLVYQPAFFASSEPMDRAGAVQLEHGKLLRWKPDREELAQSVALAESLTADDLVAHLARSQPPLAAVPLGTGKVLVPVSARRAKLARAQLLRSRARRRVRTPRAHRTTSDGYTSGYPAGTSSPPNDP